jgi:ribosomal protein S17E
MSYSKAQARKQTAGGRIKPKRTKAVYQSLEIRYGRRWKQDFEEEKKIKKSKTSHQERTWTRREL